MSKKSGKQREDGIIKDEEIKDRYVSAFLVLFC